MIGSFIKFLYSRVVLFYRKFLGVSIKDSGYPSIVIGFLFTFNILSVLSAIFIIFELGFHGFLYPIVGFLVVFITIVYFRSGARHERYLQDVQKTETSKLSKLKVASLVYVIASVIIFFVFYWVYYNG